MERDEEGKGARFSWCADCEHSGRVPLVKSDAGFYAVAYARVETFAAGASVEVCEAVFLGAERPTDHRYPQAGERRASHPSPPDPGTGSGDPDADV